MEDENHNNNDRSREDLRSKKQSLPKKGAVIRTKKKLSSQKVWKKTVVSSPFSRALDLLNQDDYETRS